MRFLAAPYGPTTFFLAGELDLHAAPVIDRMFEGSAINRGGPVTIDMSAVTFCDLALAATPPGALDLMPSSSIILHGLRRNVFRLFKLLKLESRPIVCPYLRRDVDPYPRGDLPGPPMWGPYAGSLRQMKAAYRLLTSETVVR
jgi:anti-anti-sigma regulatory factor